MANAALLPSRTVEHRIHAEGIRAVARCMIAISGCSYVAGKFYSDPAAAALARQQEAERLMRSASWDIRRATFAMLEGDEDAAAEHALEQQREAQQAEDEEPLAAGYEDTSWGREDFAKHEAVDPECCAWCDEEHAVKRPAGTSHGICARHAALLEGAV